MRYLVLLACVFLSPAHAALPSVADLQQPQSSLSIALPERGTLNFRTTVHEARAGMFGVHGVSAIGDRLSLFVAGNRILSGDIYAMGGHWRLQDTGSWSRVQNAVADTPFFTLDGRPDVARPHTGLPVVSVPAPRAEPGADGNYTVDVLVLFTPLAISRLGGGSSAIALAERLIFLANTYYINTRIPVRYRLVGTDTFDGTSESIGYYQNLDALAAHPGARSLRDSVGADLVGLIRSQDGEADLCGLSAGFNGEDRSDPPADVQSERDGFFVAGMAPGAERNACRDYIFAHEMGHNFGAGHESTQYIAIPGGTIPPGAYYWKSYGHGAYCGDAGSGAMYRSIMAIGNFFIAVNTTNANGSVPLEPGDFFSNPDLLMDGKACGSEGVSGTELTEANNARAITEAAPYVAAYRGATKSETKSGRGLALGGLGLSGLFALLLLRLVRRRPAF